MPLRLILEWQYLDSYLEDHLATVIALKRDPKTMYNKCTTALETLSKSSSTQALGSTTTPKSAASTIMASWSSIYAFGQEDFDFSAEAVGRVSLRMSYWPCCTLAPHRALTDTGICTHKLRDILQRIPISLLSLFPLFLSGHDLQSGWTSCCNITFLSKSVEQWLHSLVVVTLLLSISLIGMTAYHLKPSRSAIPWPAFRLHCSSHISQSILRSLQSLLSVCSLAVAESSSRHR